MLNILSCEEYLNFLHCVKDFWLKMDILLQDL